MVENSSFSIEGYVVIDISEAVENEKQLTLVEKNYVPMNELELIALLLKEEKFSLDYQHFIISDYEVEKIKNNQYKIHILDTMFCF